LVQAIEAMPVRDIKHSAGMVKREHRKEPADIIERPTMSREAWAQAPPLDDLVRDPSFGETPRPSIAPECPAFGWVQRRRCCVNNWRIQSHQS
jgi:hypothetical protein